MRNRAESAADVDFETALTIARSGDESYVVQPDESASIVAAAGECHFELSAEVLRVGMTEQKVGCRSGVGRHVESLFPADAGDGAGGDVTHRIAAGFAGGDAGRREPPHQRGCVRDMDEVELEILTCGDVRNAVGVLFRQLGKCLQLSGVQSAERNLDALHAGRVPKRARPFGSVGGRIGELLCSAAIVAFAVVVSLAISAAAKAGLGEYPVLDLALLLKDDLVLEDVEFRSQMRRHLAG